MADPGPQTGDRCARNALTLPSESSGRTSEESRLSSMPRSSSSRSKASGWGAKRASMPEFVLAEKSSQSSSLAFEAGSGGTVKFESEVISSLSLQKSQRGCGEGLWSCVLYLTVGGRGWEQGGLSHQRSPGHSAAVHAISGPCAHSIATNHNYDINQP